MVYTGVCMELDWINSGPVSTTACVQLTVVRTHCCFVVVLPPPTFGFRASSAHIFNPTCSLLESGFFSPVAYCVLACMFSAVLGSASCRSPTAIDAAIARTPVLPGWVFVWLCVPFWFPAVVASLQCVFQT